MARVRGTQNAVKRTYKANKTLDLAHSTVAIKGDTITVNLQFPGGFNTTARIDLDFEEEIALLDSALARYEHLKDSEA